MDSLKPVSIPTDFPVKPYKGTKSVVISTVSWIGGKNPFLGWAYVAAAGIFVLLALAGLARHLIKPRYVLRLWTSPSLMHAQTSRGHVTVVVIP